MPHDPRTFVNANPVRFARLALIASITERLCPGFSVDTLGEVVNEEYIQVGTCPVGRIVLAAVSLLDSEVPREQAVDYLEERVAAAFEDARIDEHIVIESADA